MRINTLFGILLCFSISTDNLATSDQRCYKQAATRYALPAELIEAVKRQESGALTGMPVRKNNNGSFDIGPLQINSIWFVDLAARGVDLEALTESRCVNIMVGSWILARLVGSHGMVEGIAMYHAGERGYRNDPSKGLRYALGVLGHMERIVDQQSDGYLDY